MEAKYFIGGFIILFAVGIYFAGHDMLQVQCSGIQNWNPLCWLGATLNLTVNILVLILAVWAAFLGIMIMIFNSKKTLMALGFWFFSTLFIIDCFLVDPIPFVDEIFLAIVSSAFGIKIFRR